jgi:hypothetical protein
MRVEESKYFSYSMNITDILVYKFIIFTQCQETASATPVTL